MGRDFKAGPIQGCVKFLTALDSLDRSCGFLIDEIIHNCLVSKNSDGAYDRNGHIQPYITLSSKLEAMSLQALCVLVDGGSSRIASASQSVFFQS